ncbi:MAG: hypothetical protein ACTSYF_10750 [Promethearchaeota archaeon]
MKVIRKKELLKDDKIKHIEKKIEKTFKKPVKDKKLFYRKRIIESD